MKYPALQTDLLADSFLPNNTTDVEPGYWRPPEGKNEQTERYCDWYTKTLKFIQEIVKENKDTGKMGLSICHRYYVMSKKSQEKPYWSTLAMNFHVLSEEELKRFPSYINSGYAYSTGVTEGTKFTEYHIEKLTRLGVKIVQKNIKHISEFYQSYDVIINFSGVRAQQLNNDNRVFPIKGHILRVKGPWIKEFVCMTELDSRGRVPYVYPNQDYIILGGVKRDFDSNKEPSSADRE